MIEGLFQATHYLCTRFTQSCTLWVIHFVGMSFKFVAQFADFLMQCFYFFVVVHKILLIYRPILHHAETPNSKNSHSNKFSVPSGRGLALRREQAHATPVPVSCACRSDGQQAGRPRPPRPSARIQISLIQPDLPLPDPWYHNVLVARPGLESSLGSCRLELVICGP